MSQTPPLLPGPANLRVASALNVFLPGAGLFYLGRRVAGGLLAGAFLVCFVAVLVIFMRGYWEYFQIATGEDLLKGTKLEEAGAAFHRDWLLALGGIGGVLYLISLVWFGALKRRFTQPASPPR